MRSSRRALLAAVTGAALLLASLPGFGAAAGDPWADVQSEVALGRIDASVRDALSANGAKAIVPFKLADLGLTPVAALNLALKHPRWASALT